MYVYLLDGSTIESCSLPGIAAFRIIVVIQIPMQRAAL